MEGNHERPPPTPKLHPTPTEPMAQDMGRGEGMSEAEQDFAQQLDWVGIKYVREHVFHETRKWRLDFIFPTAPRKTALEIEGVTRYGKNKNGTMMLGRHQSHRGIKGDMEKYNQAALQGWLILRASQDDVKSGEALQLVERALGRQS